MSFSETMMVNGVKFATPELAERARQQQEQQEAAAEERREQRAQAFVARLKERFLATGATEDDWARQKDAIIAQARQDAALAGTDQARSQNADRYRGGA